ncbi:hypothetical protein BD626DRAFT_546490 [Schizophyllum amplum]|uniref:WD40-repeat-containing domain protein n=1 Tax=Schizophyllum amplum TaxID=97359 RepID=A0A550CMW3_9AGAR|nr:hypothetical protein BD626DRAFT_546490 [Auriculariopsis ampla]
MTSPYIKTFEVIKRKRDKLVVKLQGEDASDDDDKKLIALMKDICTVVRDASRAPNASEVLPEVLEAAEKLLDGTIMMAYDACEVYDFLPSYAHTEDGSAPFVQDPTREANLIGSLGDPLIQLMQRVLGLPPQKGGSLPSTIPQHRDFNSTPKPHKNTSPLARFRDQEFIPRIPATAPVAQAVYYGCCSISSEEHVPPPSRIITAPGMDALLMTGSNGWKLRDPFVCNYDLASVSGWKGTPDSETISTGLLDIAYHVALDPTRKLAWAADDSRAKSFSLDDETSLLPVHTLRCTRKGPLAIVDNGARVLRGGVGGIDVWNMDGLPTHGPEGDKRIGKGKISIENSWRDPDDLEEAIERSTGTPRTSSIDFNGTIEQWHFPSWWSTAGALKALTAGNNRSAVVARDLRDQGKVTMRYVGHGGDLCTITSSDADPNSFLTSASDGIVRLFDVRQPLPQLSVDSGEASERTYSALYIHMDGIPVIFTGGSHKTQGIKVWDPRAKKLVYELATGNNCVNSLAWDAPRSTLYAATECDNMDRMGTTHDYRQARIRDDDFGINDRRGQPPREPKVKKDRRDKDAMDEDEDEDDDDDEDGSVDEDEYDNELGWPERSYHNEAYFGYAWDCGDHRLIRYKFGLDADATVVPEYGQASPGGDSYW